MKIAVIGGSINGVMTAWELCKNNQNVTLFEKETLIGTTEIRQAIIDKIEPTQLEIVYLIKAYNYYFKDQIKEQDVVKSFSGLRPLVKSAKDVNNVTREYVVQINKNLISVFGGKWTVSRALAKKVASMVKNN